MTLKRKSVILVTVDCLRADHCGFLGYDRPTTPFLDQLAADSFVFTNAIAAGVPTYYSFPAILASRYPLAFGREVLGLAAGETNLASVLQQAGYRTAFFGAANPYLSGQFGYDFGFDLFSDHLQPDVSDEDATEASSGSSWWSTLNRMLANSSRRHPGLSAAYDELYFQYSQRRAAPASKSLDQLRRFPAAQVIVGEAEAWLRSAGENPFFLWLHFMDPHGPYYPTEEALALLSQETLSASRARYLNAYWNRADLGVHRLQRRRKEIVALYDAGIRCVDAQLSRLVSTLRRGKRWEDCIFALTADHGEEFLEHGARYHAPRLHEELIHVPLLLHVPQSENHIVSSHPFSLLHLAPTLLGAAEAPVPSAFQGCNLWPDLQAGLTPFHPALAECILGCTNPFRRENRLGPRILAVREGRYKLVLNFERERTQEFDMLFDLDADPQELHPLPASSHDLERPRLLRIALKHLQNAHPERKSTSQLRARIRGMKQFMLRRPQLQAEPEYQINLSDSMVQPAVD